MPRAPLIPKMPGGQLACTPVTRPFTPSADRSLVRMTLTVMTDRINEGGNAIASVRPFISTLRNQLTVELELLRVSRS